MNAKLSPTQVQDIQCASSFQDKINAIELAAIDLSLARTGKLINSHNPSLQEKLRIAARLLASNLEDSLWTSCTQIKNALKIHTTYNKWDDVSNDIATTWQSLISHVRFMVGR